ncbi:GPW/gp25 family protein [Chromobacterium subtsugae]|uniref:GPW/gp25 family protein n=1 Tax=Chromobacterium subtsugae TaxID=251747 RepID=UPI0007F90625|nr:GPW/gp25 family protein [Chromobacterium subtsugae]OBU85995.1 hypothetical protein MY55_13100 [Chromobacterium subtsugae]
MTELIPDTLYWQPALAADGVASGLADIHQTIRVILKTRKGAVPHRPEFGSLLHRYLDWPQNRISPYLVREARAAILHPVEGEPRAEVVDIEVELLPGEARLRIGWRVKGGGNLEQTQVEWTR